VRSYLAAHLLAGACLCVASAQSLSFTGPTSGFVFDAQAKAIRPIVGVPGAAYLGPPAVSGVEWASLAPDGKTALVVQETRLFLVRNLASSQPSWIPLDAARPLLASWSRTPSAAIYTAGTLQIVNAASDAPVVTSIDVATLGGAVTRLAVDANGQHVYLAVQGETGGGVYVASAAFPPRLVVSFDRVGALALLPEGLLVGAASGERLLLVRDPAGFPDVADLAADPGAAHEWVGATGSRDGRSIFIADRSSASILIFEIPTGTWVSPMGLDLPPTRLEPLAGGNLCQLNAPGAGTPLLVLKTDGTPGVFFVPTVGPAVAED
jgi:hypothetical protein